MNDVRIINGEVVTAKRAMTTAERLAHLEQLVTGQRRDFDTLAQVLQLRDIQAQSLSDSLTRLDRNLAGALGELLERLGWHEAHVLPLRHSRKALDRHRTKVEAARLAEERRVAAKAAREAANAAKPVRQRGRRRS